jgi:hypothetical protein
MIKVFTKAYERQRVQGLENPSLSLHCGVRFKEGFFRRVYSTS